MVKGTDQRTIGAQAGRAGPRRGIPRNGGQRGLKTTFCVWVVLGCGTVSSLERKVGCFGGSRLRDGVPMWDTLFAAGRNDRSDEQRSDHSLQHRALNGQNTGYKPHLRRRGSWPHHQEGRDPEAGDSRCKWMPMPNPGIFSSWKTARYPRINNKPLRAGGSLSAKRILTSIVGRQVPGSPSRAAGNSGFLQTGASAGVILHFAPPWFRASLFL